MTQITGDTGVSKVQDGVIVQADLAPNVVGNGPAFSSSADGSQTLINAAGQVKVLLTVETFDTNGAFAASRFTPSVAGYYQFNYTVESGTNSLGRLIAFLYKNGAVVGRGSDSQTSSAFSSTGSSLVYLNGTTDYVEMFGYCNGANAVLSGTTQLSGFLARAT